MENVCDRAKTVKNKQLRKSRQQCLICGKYISDRRNLVRHLRRIHCIEPHVRKPQLKCSFNDDCTFICATSEVLREHLKNAHDLNVEQKILNFKSHSDFEKWKQEEELNTNARYVSYTGTKFRGTSKVYYFKCHRSGVVRSEAYTTDRKRSKPAKGYTQCGTTCPSTIRLVESAGGSLQAMYYPIHLGHTLDDESIPYIKLSLKEKEEIAGKLAKGEPVGKIVSDARKKKGSKLSRINLLQRRDVYNIKKRVTYLEKEEDEDGKIIDDWVRDLGLVDMADSPAVLYCPTTGKTKQYTLVLIHRVQKIIYSVAYDGSIVYVKTKKGKPNVDFNLTTITVICENGDCYPIAFCLSHKTEYITLYTFFKIVYQNFGSIKAQIFVSDNMAHIYLAWKNVMGECDNKLICTFDLETYWEQKLTATKCPVSKQTEVTDRLKSLLYQMDKDAFELDLFKSLNSWKEDEDTVAFASYFDRFYAKKRFEWATCYRIHSTRKESINLYLEPMNAALESIYVESYCSLRQSLNCLVAFVRDVCYLKLLKWDDHMAAEKTRDTQKTHLDASNVTQVRSNGSEWVVRDDDSDYVVTRIDSECDKNCRVFCEACDICTHNYNCVCSDYVTAFNICRHVHAVAIFTRGNNGGGDSKDPSAETSKQTALLLVKSLATELENSDLTTDEYNGIIDRVTEMRRNLMKISRDGEKVQS